MQKNNNNQNSIGSTREKNDFKPISEEEEIFLKKKINVQVRRTPPVEVGATKRETFERRDKHSTSLIEASSETERIMENRNQQSFRRQENTKEEYIQLAQQKQTARGEETGAPRNQLFDIHEKLLMQLAEMRVIQSFLGFTRKS